MIAHSYGAGVQSRTVLYLVRGGFLRRPDAIYFADTMCEPEEVYRAIEQDQIVAEEMGIPFRIVRYANLAKPPNGIHTPVFTLNAIPIQKKRKVLVSTIKDEFEGEIRGYVYKWFTMAPFTSRGQLMRTCTDRFKIKPIRRDLRKHGVKKCEMWLGISTDEWTRMKPSGLLWVENTWPLIDLGISREDCISFLEGQGIEATKSACVFCPYKNKTEWLRLSGKDLEDAVAYDESIRHARTGYLCFVHPSRLPLLEALKTIDLTIPQIYDEHDAECSGNCFS